MGELTQLLDSARRGDLNAQKAFFARIYQQLERLASSYLDKRSPLTLIDAPALVREAYLRMSKLDALPGSDRNTFLAYASRVMRTIVIDYVRSRNALRNQRQPITLSTGIPDERYSGVQIDLLADTLDELSVIDERAHQVVEMRFFGGMEIAEIGDVLGISSATVKRDWDKARAFLLYSMKHPQYSAG